MVSFPLNCCSGVPKFLINSLTKGMLARYCPGKLNKKKYPCSSVNIQMNEQELGNILANTGISSTNRTCIPINTRPNLEMKNIIQQPQVPSCLLDLG